MANAVVNGDKKQRNKMAWIVVGCIAAFNIYMVTVGSIHSPFYDIIETDVDGKDFLFSQFEGTVVYAVNVASVPTLGMLLWVAALRSILHIA